MLLFRGREDADMDEELRFHLDMETERNVARGMDPRAARRQARIAFGGLEGHREVLRGGRRWPVLEDVVRDLRYGMRSLLRVPGFTATIIVILTLGIGSSTAMFTAFHAVMLQEFPVTDPGRLVALSLQADPAAAASLVPDEVDALRRESRTLRDVAGVASFGTGSTPLREGDRPLVLSFTMVTANFFDVLGARPALGRTFRPEDAEAGAVPVTVISHRTWQEVFGGDPDVLDRRLTASQQRTTYAIVGVAPPGLDYPVGIDYWTLPTSPRLAMSVLGRLAPDVTPEAARAEFLTTARALDNERATPRPLTGATVRSFDDAVLGDTRPLILAVTTAVALLLLIACVNVGNLLLMRATGRHRDVAVRRALGATSGGIARLFLAEGALLGAAGGALGLACAVALLRVLPAWAPAQLPRMEMVGLAGRPLVVGVGVTLGVVLLFGAVPALVATRAHLAAALRIDGRSGTGTARRRRLRQSLVAAQVALAVILLVGAGLLVRSLQKLEQLELGYETDGLAIVELAVNRENSESPREIADLLEGVLARMRAVPGVTAVTPLMSRPFIGGTGIYQTSPRLEGQSQREAEANPRVPLEVGGPEFFQVFGLPILRGRGLLENDREDDPKVAVVSRAVAQRLWPDDDPVGKRIGMMLPDEEWWTVVGVADDTRFRRLREATPTIYLPWRQLQILPGVWTVAVRTEPELASVVPGVRRAIRDFDARVDVWQARTLSEHLADGPLAQPRMSALLLSGFGLAALLLAAIGLYGVMALAVRERTRELGIRTALGATAARLRRDVLRDALSTTVMGALAGLGVALLVSRLLVAMLFEVSPLDPVTLVAVCATLLAVSVIAAYLPARRATRLDPMRALRED